MKKVISQKKPKKQSFLIMSPVALAMTACGGKDTSSNSGNDMGTETDTNTSSNSGTNPQNLRIYTAADYELFDGKYQASQTLAFPTSDQSL